MFQARVGRSRAIAVALFAAVAALTLAGVGQRPAGAAVTAVEGSATGYFVSASFFGGPPILRGPAPTVTLPPGGSAVPITDTVATGSAVIGPAYLFTSGPITVTTQGTPGPTGSVTSTSHITQTNTSDVEILTAGAIDSTCTASESGVSGSTTITGPGDFRPPNTAPANATLKVSSGDPDVEGDEVFVEIPTNPTAGLTIEGDLEEVGDSFRVVFNEQILNPDGSITVNAVHQYLLGPSAVGDVILGQVTCGATSDMSTTTTVTGRRACNGLAATIVGTDGADTINGTRGRDVIVGLGGDDTINGVGGDDVICGGSGNDTLTGGSGRDYIQGDAGDDTVQGQDGDDRVFGDGGSDTVTGGNGDDVVSGGGGDDFLNGDDGDDRVEGNAGDDRVVGGRGDDDLRGHGGRDLLNAVQGDGGVFADTLDGGPQVDQCFSDLGDTPPGLTGADCTSGTTTRSTSTTLPSTTTTSTTSTSTTSTTVVSSATLDAEVIDCFPDFAVFVRIFGLGVAPGTDVTVNEVVFGQADAGGNFDITEGAGFSHTMNISATTAEGTPITETFVTPASC